MSKTEYLLPNDEEEKLKLLAESSLYEFYKQALPVIDGSGYFSDEWFMRIIAEHLENVYYRKITKLLINVPPRLGKPVGQFTLLQKSDGSRVYIKDINEGDYILTDKGRYRKVLKKYYQGLMDVYTIKTFCYREVIAEGTHPFLTTEGWKEARNLKITDTLASVETREDNGINIPLEEARLLGYIIGDGCVVGNQCNITCADNAQLDDMINCVNKLGFNYHIFRYKRKETHKLLTKFSLSKGINSVRDWCKKHNLAGKSSYTKKVPNIIFKSNKEVIGNFLGAYIACDGSVYKQNNRKDMKVEIGSVSEDLMKEINHLLNRLGIKNYIRKCVNNRVTKRQGNTYTHYKLRVCEQDDVYRLAKSVPIYGEKQAKLLKAVTPKIRFDRNYLEDPILSIEKGGTEECYCLEVEEDHTFTANDIVVHNTSLISIAFPVWVWIHNPNEKFLCSSITSDLSLDIADKSRMLLMSDWFKSRWGDRFKLRADQNAKGYFVNDKNGYRYSTSVTSAVIGRGGNILICMPYNTQISTRYGRYTIGEIVEKKLDIKVLSYNHKLCDTEYKSIKNYYKHEGKQIYKLELYVCAFQNGITIEATEEHPIYIVNIGYKPIKNIKEYDRCLYNIDGIVYDVVVKSVTKQQEIPEYVYNLEIEGNNNYFANNILVHNCDDPNAVGGESEVIRDATNRWWSLKWFNRIILSDVSPTCRVLVQQRGDELDVSGNIIANDINNEWVKLILPLEFEKDYVIPTSYLPDFVDDTLLPDYKSVWQDIRTEEGELLTERMSITEVEQLKKELGSYDYAAIYQQRPAPLEGGIIKKHWFRVYKSRQLPRFEYIVQSWDTALTAKQNSAYSACTTWGIFRDAKDNTNVMLLSCWRDRLEYPELRERVKRLSVNYMDTSNVPIVYNPFYNPDMIVIEAKASGDPLIADLNRAGVYAEPFVPNQHGDKLQRVRLITPLIEGGMVWLPIDVENSIDIYEPASFAKDFVNEVAYFPNPRSLDYVDTMTQALIVLRNLGKLMNPGDYIEPDDASIGRNVIY